MFKENKKQINLIVRWAGTLLSLIILYFLIKQIGIDETWNTLKQIAFWRLAVVLVLVFVSRLATFGRWHTLLQVENIQVEWKDSLRLTFAGLFASNILPTTIGGDVFRLAGAVRLGIDGALAAASLVADRLIGMTGMALALPFGIPLLYTFFAQRARENTTAMLSSAAFITKVSERARHLLKKLLSKFSYWLKNPVILLQALGFTFVHMLAIFFIINLLLEGMGEHIPLTQIPGLWSLTYFISLLPISINGLGLQEVTITNLFSTIGGISPASSISLAVILRAVWMIGSLPGAFFLSDVLGGKTNQQKNEIGSEG